MQTTVSVAFVLRITTTNGSYARALEDALLRAQQSQSLWSGFRLLPAPIICQGNVLFVTTEERKTVPQNCLPSGRHIRMAQLYRVTYPGCPAAEQPITQAQILYPL